MNDDATEQQQRVSFVMPVWRPRLDWFAAAVHSALTQHGVTVELILVDDGNEPALETLAPEVCAKATTTIRIAHGGPSAARQAGLSHVTAPWVRFVDADDILPPDSTSALMALASHAASPQIAFGATEFCNDQLLPYRTTSCSLDGLAAEACALGEFDVMLPALLLPTATAVTAGPWDVDLAVMEDWDFVLRCLEKAPVRGTSDVVLRYRRHGRSITRTVNGDRLEAARSRLIEAYLDRNPATSARVVAELALRGQLEGIRARHGGNLGLEVATLRVLARHPRRVGGALAAQLGERSRGAAEGLRRRVRSR